MSNATILKLLDVSTGHLSKETADLLRQTSESDRDTIPFRVIQHQYGWIIPFTGEITGTESDEDLAKKLDIDDLDEIPNDLLEVIRYAARQGCTFVYFDLDGEYNADLPTFEW